MSEQRVKVTKQRRDNWFLFYCDSCKDNLGRGQIEITNHLRRVHGVYSPKTILVEAKERK